MDSFEYLIALVSVIAGLGITRSLSGLALLFNARRQVLVSWIPICWTFNILLWLVAFWWFTFLLSSFEGWSPGLHIFVLVYAGIIFFLLALLHPETIEQGHDTLEHFLENRRVYFGALTAMALVDLADTWLKYEFGLSTPPLAQYIALMTTWISMSVIGIFVRNRTYHATFAVVFLVTITLWLVFSIAPVLRIVSGDI